MAPGPRVLPWWFLARCTRADLSTVTAHSHSTGVAPGTTTVHGAVTLSAATVVSSFTYSCTLWPKLLPLKINAKYYNSTFSQYLCCPRYYNSTFSQYWCFPKHYDSTFSQYWCCSRYYNSSWRRDIEGCPGGFQLDVLVLT
jgi:hypothetical protein